MKFYPASVSFASGELSPVLYGRVDLAAYSIGAKELTNFIVLPQGGIINRPGTRVLSDGSGLSYARLIPFIFNMDTAYILVYQLGGRINVYSKSGDRITSFTGFSYSEAELQNIRWLQSADIIYIFHPNEKTQKISRYSETDWRMAEVDFKNGPYQDMNTDRTSHLHTGDLSDVAMSIYTNSSGVTYLSSSVPYFTTDHIGLLFKLEFNVKAQSGRHTLRYSAPDPAESDEFMMYGASTITTSGTWTGTVTVYRKLPTETTFSEVMSKSSQNDANLGYQEDAELYGTMFKVVLTSANSSATVNIEWSSQGGLIARSIKLTGLVNSSLMIGEPTDTVITDTGESRDWAFGAFGGMLGHPSLGIFHQERLILAGSATQRQTIWMSRSASWEDFGTDIPVVDTDAITITLASKQVDDIVGLSSRDSLLVFTIGGEWSMRAGKQNDIFTPSTVVVTPSSYHGSHNIPPLDVSSYTLFAQRHGKTVRGMGYQLDSDGYVSNDISVLSSHFFENTRISRWDYQQEPWSVIWLVLESGEVLSLTVQEEHKVTAWTRCVFRTPIREVCCIPGEEQDEVFFLAWDLDGNGQPLGAKLLMMNHRHDTLGTKSDTTYLDEGNYPYVSVLEGMELEENANGSLQGRFKHVPEVVIRVFRTCGFHAGIITENSSKLDQVKFPGQRSPAYLDAPYTGDIVVSVPGGIGRQSRVRVENREAIPAAILGIYQTVDIGDGK